MLGILDLKSIGCYKIKQGIFQQNLSKYYRFESAEVLCEQFHELINTLKKEKEEMKDKYPWLEQDYERRNMSDKEILENTCRFRKSMSVSFRKETSNRYVIQI